MDKLVDRVTVLQGSGSAREAETVYDSRQEEYPQIPIDGIVRSVTVVEGGTSKVIFRSHHWDEPDRFWRFDEGALRRFLKADMIRAQETYRQHQESASDDRQLWWLDLPANMVRAFIKAGREISSESRKERDEADDAEAGTRTGTRETRTRAPDTRGKAKGI